MKRIISALLCFIMLFSMVVSAAALTNNEANSAHTPLNSFKVGDANSDGKADAVDALEIKKSCRHDLHVYRNISVSQK